MDISKKISDLMKEKSITQKEISEKINMSITGFQKALNNNDFKTSVLIKIADVLGVPIGYFFDNESNDNISTELHDVLKTALNYNFNETLKYWKRFSGKSEEYKLYMIWSDALDMPFHQFNKPELDLILKNNLIDNSYYDILVKMLNYREKFLNYTKETRPKE